MTKNYDLVVVDSGTAAMVGSMQIRAAGRGVAIIDYRPCSGTCTLRVAASDNEVRAECVRLMQNLLAVGGAVNNLAACRNPWRSRALTTSSVRGLASRSPSWP